MPCSRTLRAACCVSPARKHSRSGILNTAGPQRSVVAFRLTLVKGSAAAANKQRLSFTEVLWDFTVVPGSDLGTCGPWHSLCHLAMTNVSTWDNCECTSFSIKRYSTLHNLLDSAPSSDLPWVFFQSLVWEFFLQSLFCSFSGSLSKLKPFSTLLLQWTVELYSSLLESNQVSSEVKWDFCAVLAQQKLSIQAKLRRAGKYENSSVIGNYMMTFSLHNKLLFVSV